TQGITSSTIQKATAAVQALNINLVQFGQLDAASPVTLYRINVLDPTEGDFAYFGWIFLMDWARGYREAVTLAGDSGTLTVLTDHLNPIQLEVNLAQAPTMMAVYLRNTVLFITVAMIVMASVMLAYIVSSRGHFEVSNLYQLQRVGAFVWVGRPLVLVRSLTAVALLSTATMQLAFSGYISYFQVTQDIWYKPILAANEVTWMVSIVNDIAMAVTQDHTRYYAAINSILAWLVVVSLSLAMPVSHSFLIDKQCHVVDVDFQVVCDSGSLTIGQVSRLAAILGAVIGCNALCFVVTWILVRHPRPSKINSFFVYAGARYLFKSSPWIYNDVYYLDRMSAVLNGILTLRWGGTIHGLDVKLWRVFQVDQHSEADIPTDHPLAIPARYTIPLSLLQN
ncbi:hypothetical protein As57867_023263, partial [Aphanomyces stellatus]